MFVREGGGEMVGSESAAVLHVPMWRREVGKAMEKVSSVLDTQKNPRGLLCVSLVLAIVTTSCGSIARPSYLA